MISRQHRFHGYNSLRFVYQKGQTVRQAYLSLKYVANSRRSQYRCAVVVGKKVHKSAVVRNRIRRRIYEIVRHQEKQLSNYDLVFTVFSEEAAKASSEELE